MKKEYKDKFIGFVDILGWKEKVELSEQGIGMSLDELTDLLERLGTSQDKIKFKKSGPIICPNSTYIERDLDFQITQISDCVIVSSEISPAGIINLVHHFWTAVLNLLTKGIMCRGYITRGKIYHTDDQWLIGSGYQEALKKEQQVSAFKRKADERGTPFVEVDPIVCYYVENCKDSCVKKMFYRYVEDDGSVKSLFPFKNFIQSFIIGDWMGHKFNHEKECISNDNLRLMIIGMKESILSYVDKSNQKAVNKAKYYIDALDKQLEECQKTKELLLKLDKNYQGKDV